MNYSRQLCSPVLLLLLLAPLAESQKISAQQYVQDVIANELQADKADKSQWKYLSRKQHGGKTETRWVVETPQGDVSRLIAIDGRSLSPQDQEKEKRRIEKLQQSDEAQKVQRDQQEDEKKARELLDLIRSAFLFQYVTRTSTVVRLSFKPNPAFKPQSHEAQVLHAMAGILTVNARERRLAALSGRMVTDVNFGGGVLGHLYPGGTFAMQRKEVEKNIWNVTLIDVHLKGRALLFKSISEDQHEVRSNFQRVPDGITIAQAISVLQGQQAVAKAR